MTPLPPEPMADVAAPDGVPPADSAPLLRAAFVLGAAALLVAMVADATAVAGRHLGIPLLGAVEIVQLSAGVVGATSILLVTLGGGHAAIHVLTDRVDAGARRWLSRLARLLAALFFAILAVGCGWVALDLVGGRERTDILGVAVVPFRLLVTACFALAAAAFLRPGSDRRRAR